MRPEYPFEAPEYGEFITIAPQITWARLPLPMALNHINIYILHDDDGLTIIDTGLKTDKLKAMWQDLLARLDAPVRRLVVTHYHPDHIGLAGWFMREYGVELWTSRQSFLLARMLQFDVQERPTEANIAYWRRAGYEGDWIEDKCQKRPFNFLDSTESLPVGVRTLLDGDVFKGAGREWQVRFGAGHAPDHLTFWHPDLVLIGDHCLPAITPVISVYSGEPYADPISEFIATTEALVLDASDEQLFLPGHNRPFYGGRSRMLALVRHHYETLDQLREALKEPKTMIDCYPILFHRKITPELESFAISEAVAHFNYLWLRGEIEMVEGDPIRWVKC